MATIDYAFVKVTRDECVTKSHETRRHFENIVQSHNARCLQPRLWHTVEYYIADILLVKTQKYDEVYVRTTLQTYTETAGKVRRA